MIRRPTLFVVGAGASSELSFPTGGELLDRLLRLFNVERDVLGRWTGSGQFIELAHAYSSRANVDVNLVLEKARFIRSKILGTQKSIDQLVHTYSDDQLFAGTSKLGIAKIIADSEATNLPRVLDHLKMSDQPWTTGNWLHTFCKYYFAGFRKNDIDQIFSDVSFVCYNYDRCLEYALLRAAAHHFDLPEQVALELPKRFKIVHPYGSLGKLPHSQAELYSTFENGRRNSNVVEMSYNIRTFTEGTGTEIVPKEISELVRGAENVVCLGFGYNSMNVGLFSNPDDGNRKNIYGTTYLMTDPNAFAAQNQFCRQLKSDTVSRNFKSQSAKDFIEEFELEIFR
jgi:hypothetical protein